MKQYISAIIVAAGSSSRMGGKSSKQLLKLSDKPVLYYSIKALNACPLIDQIIIVCREQDKKDVRKIVINGGFSKVEDIAVGGETRMRSVANGISCASMRATHFCIHDGARPLIKVSEIEKVIGDALMYDASTLGCPVTDTIKQVGFNNIIEKTLDRSSVMAVQTPQVFKESLYIKALENAEATGLNTTDDCALIEALGERVHITEGSASNIKITYPYDIAVAEYLMKAGI